MGREVGGGIGMGKTCKPKAFSFQCMTKFTTNKRKKKRSSSGLVFPSEAFLEMLSGSFALPQDSCLGRQFINKLLYSQKTLVGNTLIKQT